MEYWYTVGNPLSAVAITEVNGQLLIQIRSGLGAVLGAGLGGAGDGFESGLGRVWGGLGAGLGNAWSGLGAGLFFFFLRREPMKGL